VLSSLYTGEIKRVPQGTLFPYNVAMVQNVIIFIDGENFFRCIKENFFNYNLGHKDSRFVKSKDIKEGFDLVAFCKYLTRADSDVLKEIYYYDARLGNGFPIEAISSQNRFLKNLGNKGVVVRIGKVENNRQKGTDVFLATDLLTLGWRNKYNLALLLSNDKDFRPAIDSLQRSYKNCKLAVQYCHFHHGYCRALDEICARVLKIRNGEIYRFCSPNLQKKWLPSPNV